MIWEISQNSQENTCARVYFLIQLQALACNFIKKRLWHRCLPFNIAKFLRTPFLQNTSGRLLLFFGIRVWDWPLLFLFVVWPSKNESHFSIKILWALNETAFLKLTLLKYSFVMISWFFQLKGCIGVVIYCRIRLYSVQFKLVDSLYVFFFIWNGKFALIMKPEFLCDFCLFCSN